ncbi:MAG TPA: DUF5667 domain-containing protein [Euzebyales bacterium]|nr:DUF5667 domain-containing protein [Euzebyales bacterium]
MRVLGVLAAWGVLAVLATMFFALGGSLGYRRGVRDTLNQIRERRSGNGGCRPLPANHMRRRSSGHARPGARARRTRWRPRHAGAAVVGPTRAAGHVRSDPRVVALSITVAALLLIGVPGAAIGATTARPGESLYTVRRGLENARVALARGAEDDAKVHVELAAARLVDLQGLVGDDAAPEVITDVSLNLADHADAAASQLTAVADPTRSTLGARLEDVTTKQVEVMDDLVPSDCDSGHCRALHETRQSTVALRETTEHEVAVSDRPVQADKDGVVTASEVEDPSADAPVAATGTDAQDAGDAEPSDAGTSEDVSPPTAADAAAGRAPQDATSEPSPKPSNGTEPTATPSPIPSPPPSNSPTPTEPPAGSPATEPDAPPAATSGAGGTDATAPDTAGQ